MKKGKVQTFDEWRLEAQLSIHQLAALAKVDRRTATRAQAGEAIQAVKAVKLLQAIGKVLKKEMQFSDVSDLKIARRKGETNGNKE